MTTPICSFTLIFLCLVAVLAEAEEISVAAASNFTAPMKALAAEFERLSGHKVKLTFGASGKLFAQIKNGAPFQVLFSADQTKPIALEKAGIAVPGSRFTYAIGALVLWSSRANLDEAMLRELLASKQMPDTGKLALANPRLAPYGVAAVEVLASLELEQVTRSNWVQGENISQTFQFVDSGNADVGFVALAQVLKQGNIQRGSAWVIPPELYRPIRQDAVLLSSAKDNPAARELLQFIRSSHARNIIHRFGYLTEPAAP